MAVPFRPEGTWTALVTPFDARGKLDAAAYKRLCEFQIAEGISGLVPTGTANVVGRELRLPADPARG